MASQGQRPISAGTLQLANANGLVNSTVTVNDTLAFDTLGSAISNFNLGGLGGSGNVNLSDSGGNAANLTVGGNGASTTFSGQLSGLGTLMKVGTGSTTLAGNDSYSGATAIAGGTLTLASANAAANSTVAVNVYNGLVFDTGGGGISGFNLGGLSGGGNVNLTDADGNPANVIVGSNSATTNFSGQLSGSGGRTVVGGNLTLGNSNNTMTGGINISWWNRDLRRGRCIARFLL